jgi:hypothetical protein
LAALFENNPELDNHRGQGFGEGQVLQRRPSLPDSYDASLS